MKRIAFYIDSHGFGHTTRSISLASQFPPDWKVHFRTNGPEWLFREELSREFEIHPSPLDIHPIHSEGYVVDAERTRLFLLEGIARAEDRIESEVAWLDKNRIDTVLSDISPLAIEAAYRCGVPCFGVSNFTWHWILEPMLTDAESRSSLERLSEMIGHATKNFRLPLSVPEVFPGESVDTPLLSRTPRSSREAFRSKCGMDADCLYILVTFGGFDSADRDLERLEEWSPIRFVRTLPHNTRRRNPRDRFLVRSETLGNLYHYVHPELHHPDLVGAVDAVITKPGYGILSETLPLGTPMLLDTREDFREFQVILDALRGYPQISFLPSERMERLDFGKDLESILKVERIPWKGRTDGAEFIVDSVQ